MSDFLTASDVAPIIGYETAASFLRDRERLERRLAFPAPMPTCQRPLKWRAAAVRAWREDQLDRVKGIHAAATRTTQEEMMAEARRV